LNVWGKKSREGGGSEKEISIEKWGAILEL